MIPIYYTIMYFPLISQPTYNVIRVLSLPFHNRENIFTTAKIRNNIIVPDKEGQTFLQINENELNKCLKLGQNDICEKSHPMYRINLDTPCEIQMYLQRQRYRDICNTEHILLTNTIWIPLHRPNEWLYSTKNEKKITISCENYSEDRIIIKKTGKITLQENCKIIASNMILENKGTILGGNIETYLPEINIPLLQDSNDTRQDEKSILANHSELKELSNKLKNLNSELRYNDDTFYAQKQFIIPMTSSIILIVTLTAIIIWTIIKNKKEIRKLRTAVLSSNRGGMLCPEATTK